ncbi:uncharacterized protein LOC128748897 isoform X4 [Synchiropus splendidus]|uniref:uncharacterized protein LOC128748897 isoform X4 n=1 Tax=Synchiropus splendidus TaxID=270530 RepID=UPI00237D397D|nr:uncharacterized protein LOC128748897 isoform X4 [Synchiropus splendidus]
MKSPGSGGFSMCGASLMDYEAPGHDVSSPLRHPPGSPEHSKSAVMVQPAQSSPSPGSETVGESVSTSSERCWGGHLDQICVSGICSSSEGRQINLLELLEVLVALSPYLSGNHVMTMWHQKNYLGDHSQMNGVYLRRWQTWSKVSDADQRPLGVPSIEVSASASIRNPEGSPNNRTTPQGLASPGLTISHLPTDVQLTLQNAKAPSTLRGYNAQWTFFSR